MKTIGLCMIVKDEAHVIVRCLDSVKPLVDYRAHRGHRLDRRHPADRSATGSLQRKPGRRGHRGAVAELRL